MKEWLNGFFFSIAAAFLLAFLTKVFSFFYLGTEKNKKKESSTTGRREGEKVKEKLQGGKNELSEK